MTKSREELVEDLAVELDSVVCHGWYTKETDPARLFRLCRNDCARLREKIRAWMDAIKPAAPAGTPPEKGPKA